MRLWPKYVDIWKKLFPLRLKVGGNNNTYLLTEWALSLQGTMFSNNVYLFLLNDTDWMPAALYDNCWLPAACFVPGGPFGGPPYRYAP